ncbi:RING/FYVE/PHD zinc finger superfamily protein [Striga hermonthica]|uniref:RING/FYVE/PHD zinc finger superfamily protein n=1 Tax=Striga hermonthica TaxID=68872 RepID=A0A9N7N2B0_STRHE|nr:RING/FYVE/PHD zinc finger superfamily protein [Striga hermonthica]
MSETILFIEDLRPNYETSSICRICHEEEEFESCKSLETPCACSGSLKFAHRDCVQRWCYEKGDTICEICLQKFEPGYKSPPKKTHQIETTVTIRESLEVPRNEEEEENRGQILETEDYESECASEADKSAACCRSVALILTALLLARHLFAVVIGGEETYPLSLLTVIIVKASGIILPMYILIRISALLHNSIRHHHHQNSDSESDDEDEDEEQHNDELRA